MYFNQELNFISAAFSVLLTMILIRYDYMYNYKISLVDVLKLSVLRY